MSNEQKTLLEEARETINRVDREMARLFEERMNAVRKVAEYKMAHGLQVLDPEREKQVIERNSALIEDGELRAYYVEFLKNNMAHLLVYGLMMILDYLIFLNGYCLEMLLLLMQNLIIGKLGIWGLNGI